ncbi:MAG: alpha/beta hydrolase [Bacteroidia bacterium]|nr:alpha/beta hydrolase [Bacteroidia bacterium]
MQHSIHTIKQGKYSYYAQLWEPEKVDASLLIIHGHAEHSSRYTHVADYLAKHDIAVLAMDLYGHGKSEGKKGHVPSYDVYLDSVGAALDWMQQRFAKQESFLYGHSMGGNIVTNFVMKRKPQIRGTILSGPYFQLAFKPSSFQVMLAKSAIKMMPALTQPTNLDAKGLSRDQAVVKAYKDDPLVHGMISPVAFLGVEEAGKWVLNHASQWDGSLLLMHGEKDPVTSLAASKEFIKKVPHQNQDVTFKEWEGHLHEIHNEIGKEEVIEMLKNWISERM